MELMTEEKKGFKRTEIGLLPEDWDIIKISDLIDKNIITSHLDGNHGALYPRSNEFVNHGVPYITANDFIDGHVNFDNVRYLPVKRAEQFKKGVAKDGDVLFAHNATVGPTALLSTNYDYVILSTTATYFRVDLESLNNRYLKYFFESDLFKDQYTPVMRQSTRDQVPITQQRKFSVALPPTLEEQQAIASALSDVDKLIRSLDGLIQKKQAIKKGSMQQLLTGKKRLPGFDGEWEVKMIADFGDVVTGGTPSTLNKEFWNGDIPWITPTDISQPKDIYTSDRLISDQGLKQVRRLPKNSLLVTCIASIGKNAVLRRDGACNQQINAIIPNNSYDVDFLYYLIEQNKQKLLSNSGKTATAILSKNKFGNIEFLMPEFEEQKTIAQILSDMDYELQTLRQKREKYVHIKQGMMQELLTGKVRLV